jgi:hypothetical protein
LTPTCLPPQHISICIIALYVGSFIPFEKGKSSPYIWELACPFLLNINETKNKKNEGKHNISSPNMPLWDKIYFELKVLKNKQQVQEGHSDPPHFLPESER